MADIIKEKFRNKAVIYDNIWLYFIKTAIDVVYVCEKNRIAITVIEAFKLTGEGIQSSQEHSISFNADDGNWNRAIEFFKVALFVKTDFLKN